MSKERKTGIKTFHVFEKPQIIRSPESSKQGNLYNQLKNFKGVFIDPYIVVADYDTKLVHVLEKGERKTIFTPFDGELSYVKASPTRGSPLALFGYDYQEANKVLKVKYFAYNSLSKVIC